MFLKDNGKLESLIGANTNFQGELNVSGTLRVDGRVDGKVNAECVILSETAVIKGEVAAKKIIVGGKIEGNLRAQEIVEIKAKGKVLGDILANKLSVAEGGEFNGKIEMKMDESKIINFEAKSREGSIFTSETPSALNGV
ncbi:MAG: polymer-forming cytoskeletal protein [Deltaproteobacteria bacterium]|nr:polymer-forming cytoskeletal protein [Deltaproteobacteria bacterium]